MRLKASPRDDLVRKFLTTHGRSGLAEIAEGTGIAANSLNVVLRKIGARNVARGVWELPERGLDAAADA